MVLLPAPLGPTMAKISPSFTSKVTPSTARMPPKAIGDVSGLEQGRRASSELAPGPLPLLGAGGWLQSRWRSDQRLTARAPS